MGNPRARPPVAVADPERRFCVQCGDRNHEHSGEDKARCSDCADTPVPARFFAKTGKRIDGVPAKARPLLSSYAGSSFGDGIPVAMHGSHVSPIRALMNDTYTWSR